MYNARIGVEDRAFSQRDPAKFLRLSRILEQANPEAKKLPPEFIAGTDGLCTGSKVF